VEAVTATFDLGAPCPPPDAAWFRWDGRLWATNGHILVDESAALWASGWVAGVDESIRRELFAQMDGARWRNCNETGPRCQLEDNDVGIVWRQDGRTVAVDACYWQPIADAYAIEQGDDWRGPLRCLNHKRKAFAFVMPLDYEPAELEADVAAWEAAQ
tara:strand:- start:90 stop:563 length:474 start_codon:yes stop_codon:yes gene_type:complete